jgi:hypothetical protein
MMILVVGVVLDATLVCAYCVNGMSLRFHYTFLPSCCSTLVSCLVCVFVSSVPQSSFAANAAAAAAAAAAAGYQLTPVGATAQRGYALPTVAGSLDQSAAAAYLAAVQGYVGYV